MLYRTEYKGTGKKIGEEKERKETKKITEEGKGIGIRKDAGKREEEEGTKTE